MRPGGFDDVGAVADLPVSAPVYRPEWNHSEALSRSAGMWEAEVGFEGVGNQLVALCFIGQTRCSAPEGWHAWRRDS